VLTHAAMGLPLDAPIMVPCRNVLDCADGALGQGAICDRSMHGGDPLAEGLCRDACRDDGDCAEGFLCVLGLDPTDVSWGGCWEVAQLSRGEPARRVREARARLP
jgi:hypothetical protein